MAKPWEKYAQNTSKKKPWENYGSSETKVTTKEEQMRANEPQGPTGFAGALEKGAESSASLAGRVLSALKIPQALDYVGGNTRTSLVAPVLEKLSGKDVYHTGEATEALKGNPLSSAEILARLGMEEGKSLSDVFPNLYNKTGKGLRLQAGGWADPTLRGSAGFAMDVATDPLTYGTLGIAPAMKAGAKALRGSNKIGSGLASKVLQTVPAITNPATEGLMPAGKAMYKAGFKPLDAVSAKFGKEPVSEIAWRYGMRGTNKQIAKQADEAITKLSAQRDAILNSIDQAGHSPDMARAMEPAKRLADEFEMSNVPQKEQLAKAMRAKIADYESRAAIPEITIPETRQMQRVEVMDSYGAPTMREIEQVTPAQVIPGKPGPTANQLQDMKQTFTSQELGNNAFKEGAAANAKLSSRGGKAFGVGMKNELERLAELVREGGGQKLAQVNSDMGGLLTTATAMDKEALKGANKNLITSVDPIVATLGYGAKGDIGGSWWALALKKLADLSKTTYGRTNVGRGLYNLGNLPGADAVIRRSPWQEIYEEDKKRKEKK